nr:DoxX family protein [Halogranum amylolyticum]
MSRSLSSEQSARLGPVLVRLALAIPMVVSGVGKVLGAGPKAMGITGFAGFLASLGIPLPTVVAWGVGLLELVGGVLLIVGLFVRVTGALLAVNMLVATVLVHLPSGYPTSDGGVELTLTLCLLGLSLLASGPGTLSLERTFFGDELLASTGRESTRAD